MLVVHREDDEQLISGLRGDEDEQLSSVLTHAARRQQPGGAGLLTCPSTQAAPQRLPDGIVAHLDRALGTRSGGLTPRYQSPISHIIAIFLYALQALRRKRLR